MSSVQTSQFSSAAVTGWLMSCEWKRQSHVSKSRCHTCFSIEKLTRGEQLLVLVIEKINTGRTSIPCDWVIDRWGPVVLPVDWAIDSGRGFALGFDWPRSSRSSWEAGRVSLQADEGRCQLSTQLQSPSFLSVCCVFSVSRMCTHAQTLHGTLSQLSPGNMFVLKRNLPCRSSALLTSLFGFSGSQTASLT